MGHNKSWGHITHFSYFNTHHVNKKCYKCMFHPYTFALRRYIESAHRIMLALTLTLLGELVRQPLACPLQKKSPAVVSVEVEAVYRCTVGSATGSKVKVNHSDRASYLKSLVTVRSGVLPSSYLNECGCSSSS